jgi:ribulose-phosphate 3-epimerase
MERIVSFATRVHIDLADGSLAPTHLTPVDQVWWPGGVRADIHVMYKSPLDYLPALIALQPQLIIVHAESSGSFMEFSHTVRSHGIEAGVAILPETPVEAIAPGLDFIDHVLVFSGDLGKFGGRADPGLLPKVAQLKQLKPQLEIGWDGGINTRNAGALAKMGVEVLNVGGYIQHASDPVEAFAGIQAAVARAHD